MSELRSAIVDALHGQLTSSPVTHRQMAAVYCRVVSGHNCKVSPFSSFNVHFRCWCISIVGFYRQSCNIYVILLSSQSHRTLCHLRCTNYAYFLLSCQIYCAYDACRYSCDCYCIWTSFTTLHPVSFITANHSPLAIYDCHFSSCNGWVLHFWFVCLRISLQRYVLTVILISYLTACHCTAASGC